MREAGERLLRHFPNFTSVTGTAEATTLPGQSVDFIVVGQAFHWFNHERCRPEFVRILKPNGWVAIIFNRRRSDANSLAAAYERHRRIHHLPLKLRTNTKSAVKCSNNFSRSLPLLRYLTMNKILILRG